MFSIKFVESDAPGIKIATGRINNNMKTIAVTSLILFWVHFTFAQGFHDPHGFGFGGSGHDGGNVILRSPNGKHIIVCGFFRDRVNISPSGTPYYLNSHGSEDIFINSYTPDFVPEWGIAWGGKFPDRCNQACMDGDGNLYVIGNFRDTVEFGGPSFRKISNGINDVFVAKINVEGTTVWLRQIGSTQDDQGRSIAVDHDGHLYVTGTFQGALQFEKSPVLSLNAVKNYDVFTACMSTDGDFIWSRSVGGINDDQVFTLSLDQESNIYVCGTYNSDLDFDPGPDTVRRLQHGVYPNMFILKLNAAGLFQWVNTFGGDNTLIPYQCRINGSGKLVITGTFRSTVDFDPDSSIVALTAPGTLGDAFVTMYSDDGALIWARQLGGNLNEIGLSVCFDASDNVFTTGCFEDRADFDPGPGQHLMYTDGRADNNDIYISKLSAQGAFLDAYPLQGSNEDIGYSICLGVTNEVYVTGVFSDRLNINPGKSDSIYLTSAGFTDVPVVSLLQTALSTEAPVLNHCTIYPNPLEHHLTIAFESTSFAENIHLDIYDMSGHLLYAFPVRKIAKGLNQINLDLLQLPRGIYTLRLSAGDQIFTKKLVVN
ncbi:MAG: T9SS type A sorting domain-containing protein [Saprospiraceae bacterium]|nr:T9SS type A sorting domain-containing protein [Saprospiraceae bacterium]HMW39734.1 T9SS type A sorting domain-containing protein [Saprospiraceae bacterium]HMX89043.1 T9SS type A sorting domain-containing protein [Saprospiraceae bacterium]HMZ40684.1 T9SS type A sorting domain-containing protein [Saprospiraceae bacterium]HNA63945.1 T9SS type A sorting domain-containing protein [Saprospiraceae bacterium]